MKEFKPISKSRIEVVDVLRGFALFGVLIANVPFSGESFLAGSFDVEIAFLYDFLISKKFITIFSILFGFGFYIQMSRAEKKGINFQSYFLKRMALLFLIGAVHCFLLWNGDIIMSYAFGGVFLLFLRKWSVKKLLVLAIVFTVFFTGIFYIGNNAFGWQIYDYDYGLPVVQSTTSSYLKYLRINALTAPWVNFFKDMPITLVFTFGNMLIGFILGKIDFFRRPARLRKLTNWFILLGGTIGLVASYYFHLFNLGKLEFDIPLIWVPFALITGMVVQSLCYLSIFVKCYNHPFFKRITNWFKYVGRTALTNYIAQSVFYLFVMFHCINPYGFFGTVSRGETYLIAVFFFIFQSVTSYLWLQEKRQGPLEYIWKRLSYGS
nr:DUF418 domain-containing protein [uncultured Allomuricauda sp.]